MDNTQTTVSDSSGNHLLFYSNCARIINAQDTTMLNGDSINYGWIWNSWAGSSYNWLEGISAVPTGLHNIWNVFHYYVDYNPNTDAVIFPWRVYQTRVDMNADSGRGAVIFKDRTLVQDTLGTYVSACKHANGRDWWLLASKTSSNCLYTLLSLPDTVIQYPTQCLGADYKSGDAGQAYFSPDGSKFALCGGPTGVNLYDFDRCSGELSNPTHLPFYNDIPNGIFQAGLAFSSNSRFLYIGQTTYVLQFDTWANDIAASVDTVGYYQPPPDSTSLPGPFF